MFQAVWGQLQGGLKKIGCLHVFCFCHCMFFFEPVYFNRKTSYFNRFHESLSMVSMDSPANKPTRNSPACLFLKTRAAKKHLGHPFSLHRRRRFRCHPSRWCASAAVEILMGDPHRKSMENTQTIHGAGIFTYIETP